MPTPSSVEYKLSVEGRMSKLETLVTEIKDNHLAHIQDKLDQFQWLIITTLIGVIADLLLRFIPHV